MRLSRRGLAVTLVLPLAVYAVYLVLPIVSTARLSLQGFGFLTGIEDNVTLEQYTTILRDPYYRRVWLNTVRLSTESGILTVLAGCLVAYFLWRVGGRLRAWLTVVTVSPLLVSGVVRAYGWIAVTGPAGALPTLASALGLPPVTIIYNEASVILAFVNVFLPFVVIGLLIQLDSVPVSALRAAANLGANPLQVSYKVLLPLTYRAMFSGFLLVFALATASYSVPYVLGGGRVLTISEVIFQEQNTTLNWPRAAALGLTLTVVTVLVMLLYQVIAGRQGQRGRVAEI